MKLVAAFILFVLPLTNASRVFASDQHPTHVRLKVER
jgi:hypothetical protein